MTAKLAPAALCLALATLAGCGGQRHDQVVRITATFGDSSARLDAVAHPAANGRQAPLSSVEPLIPRSLPKPSSCEQDSSGETLRISYASGRTVIYGPQCLPVSIGWLAQGLGFEARAWSSAPAAATRIVGATPAESRELRRLLRELGPTQIRRIEIKEIVENGRPAGAVRLTIDSGTTLRGEWEAAIFSRLYHLEAVRLNLRNVGRVHNDGGDGLPGVDVGPAPRDLGPVRRFVASSGARIVELRRFDTGVEVTVRTANPAVFLSKHGHGFIDALRRPQPETSVTFSVEDGAGSVVYAAGWLPNEGMSGARLDLDSCGPVNHLGAFFGPLPRCPV